MSAEQTIDAATLSDAASVPAPEGVIAEAEEKPVEATVAAEEPRPEAKSTEAKPAKVRKAKAERPVRPGFRTVLIMGYGVLVPLVAMAMVVVLTYPADGVANVLKVEITYAAALLSFLGGIRWGIALLAGGVHLRFRPIAAVTLLLPFAWLTLFMSPPVALAMLMAGFLAIALGERAGEEKTPVPEWFHRLLRPFTIMIEIALGLTLLIIVNF